MSNDLIRRSGIKDHIGELLLVYSGEELANAILNAIDNALTVPNEYMRGYEAAEREYKRPQGEWIYLNEDEPMTVECPFCHERKCCISNYCDNCGADMQKGGAV